MKGNQLTQRYTKAMHTGRSAQSACVRCRVRAVPEPYRGFSKPPELVGGDPHELYRNSRYFP